MNKNVNLKEYMEKHYFKRNDFSTLQEMLYFVGSEYANKTAFVLKDKSGYPYNVSYFNFVRDVETIGISLINNGFTGKKIALIGKNSYKWAITYLAACIVGIVVPIDKELHSDDVINFLNTSEASIILGDDSNLSKIYEKKYSINHEMAFVNFDLKTNNENFFGFDAFRNSGLYNLENDINPFKKIEVNPDDMHFLLFTSGTTGNSKGVCLSHKNICSNIFSVGSIVKVDTSTSIMSILPIHHTYECTLGFLLVISSGGSIAFCEGLRYISKNLEEYKPNIILSVPLLLEKVHNKIMKSLKEALPEKYFNKNKHIMDAVPFFMKPIIRNKIIKSLGGNLKKIIVGASAIDPDLLVSFEKFGILVLSGYGLTECAPLVAGNNDFAHNFNSVGLPIPNVEYIIDNPDSDGIGEVLVRGPNVMLGYYNNEVATNETFKNGYFKTGDLGRIDENGWLYLTGRCKSVIITKNGKNVYPEELEEMLNKNEAISESLVTGDFDSKAKDTVVKAQIIPNWDFIKQRIKTPTKEDVSNFVNSAIKAVNAKLPNFKHIKNFTIREEEFEKTTTQKIKRFGNNLKNDKKK